MTRQAATAINEGTGYRNVSTATAAMPIQRVLEKSIANTLITRSVETRGSIGLHWKYLGKVGRYWLGIAVADSTCSNASSCMTSDIAARATEENYVVRFGLPLRVNVFDLAGASNTGADPNGVATSATNGASLHNS